MNNNNDNTSIAEDLLPEYFQELIRFNTEEALEISRKILKYDDCEKYRLLFDTTWIYFDTKNILHQVPRFSDNVEKLSLLKEKYNGFDYAHSARCILYSEHNMQEEALISINIAIKQSPNNYIFWYLKSSVLLRLKKYDEAIKAVNTSIDLCPNIEPVLNLKGVILNWLSNFDHAIEVFDTVIKLNPKYHRAWNGKAYCLNAMLKFNEAVELLTEAIKIDTSNYSTFNNLGFSLCGLSRYTEASAALDNAIKINPRNHNAWSNKRQVLYNSGNIFEANFCRRIEEKLQEFFGIQITPQNTKLLKEQLSKIINVFKLNPELKYSTSILNALEYLLLPFDSREMEDLYIDILIKLRPTDAMKYFFGKISSVSKLHQKILDHMSDQDDVNEMMNLCSASFTLERDFNNLMGRLSDLIDILSKKKLLSLLASVGRKFLKKGYMTISLYKQFNDYNSIEALIVELS